MCATEIAEVRKLVKFLYNVQLAIERVVLRLETIKELGDIVADLKPALRLLQGVSQELFQVLPDVSSELNTVNQTIQDTLHATKLTTDETIIPVGKKTEAGEEILKEVLEWGRGGTYNIPNDVNLKLVKKAIALTREDCESEFKRTLRMQMLRTAEINFIDGQKAERERILAILDKKNWVKTSCGRSTDYAEETLFDESIEELKKAVLKDSEGKK